MLHSLPKEYYSRITSELYCLCCQSITYSHLMKYFKKFGIRHGEAEEIVRACKHSLTKEDLSMRLTECKFLERIRKECYEK